MTHKRKYRKFIQVLIVPDDNDEPKALSIPATRVRLLKIIAVVLAVHILMGFVGYSQFIRVYKKNRTLVDINKQLETNNKRIYDLASMFQQLVESQSKVRTALGLGQLTVEGTPVEQSLSTTNVVPEILPALEAVGASYQPTETDVKAKLGFLQRSKSGIHDFERSIPTLLPVEGILTTDYQISRLDGKTEHRGIDIAAQRGTYIKAAADGTVIFSGWTPDLGNLIIINHAYGFVTYYGHNERNIVSRNDIVRKGDNIALLGTSGHSSAPHLHFEIWKDGQPLDPKEYILAFDGL
jgi:murein DD-endopeptidase MepM/ murein hydrolase activator NlpD